jgi:hypothetical protein
MENIAVYYNRYKDKITFEHIDNEVIMKGGKWFRYSLSNDYSVAYKAYVEDGGTKPIEVFEKLVHQYNEEAKSYTDLAKKYQPYVFSSKKIDMVDPSGGPYITLKDNLKQFWPKGKYKDLFIESINFSEKECEDCESIVIFKLKNNGETSNN